MSDNDNAKEKGGFTQPNQEPQSQYKGLVLGVAAPILWSSSGMFIKLLTLAPIPLASLRFAFAALVYLPLFRPTWRRPEPALIGLMLSFTAMNLSFVAATKWTTAANAIALQSTAPFWIFLLTCLLARKVLWELAPPILVILLGLAVLVSEPGEGTTVLGNIVGASSGIFFALVSFFFSRVKRPAPEVMFYINGFGALVLYGMQPSAFDLGGIDSFEWMGLVYLGVVQTGLGHLCYYISMRSITVNQASILALLEPLLNPIWVFLAVGEIPSGYGFVGGGLIFSGIAFDGWLRLRRSQRLH